MKSFFCFILFTLYAAIGNTQTQKFFSENPDQFLKQLKVKFAEQKQPELDQMYEELETAYKGGKLNDYQLRKMSEILNQMDELSMRIYPYYHDFIKAEIGAVKSSYDVKFLDRWFLYVKVILDNTKKGQTKVIREFLDFSNDLFYKNSLLSDKSKTYKIETKDLSFEFRSGKYLVLVPVTNLKGYFDNDTTVIFETSGEYDIIDKIWYGKKGRITWERIGLDTKQAFATFSKYTIDMTKPSYSIDSALLTYPEYFSAPIYGKLLDKVTKGLSEDKVNYPQFYSYRKDFKFNRTLAPNVVVSGGFAIVGRHVEMNSEVDEPAYVEIYSLKKPDVKLFDAVSANCVFEKGKSVRMNQARINIYVGRDTINHSFVEFVYDVATHHLNILKETTGSGRARFKSTLLKLSFDTEMVDWNIDSPFIDLSVLTGKGVNAALFLSNNNFDQTTYNLARTASSERNPLNMVAQLEKSYPNGGIPLSNFVNNFGKSTSESTILPLIFNLEKDGFVNYDIRKKTINPNYEYIKFYNRSNSKERDYDILRFKGYSEGYIGRIYTDTKRLDVNNVSLIPFNDSSEVYAVPVTGTKVTVSGNRHLEFDGRVQAGRIDLVGTQFNFEYDSFDIKSMNIRNIIINVPTNDLLSERKEKVTPLHSSLENTKGELKINARFNKSGGVVANEYPKLKTIDYGFIYYQDSCIHRGRYPIGSFYFRTEPFEKDSMRTFDPSRLFFDGTLYSSDIFEPFKEKAIIQKDSSLGFITKTPAGGYGTYKKRGTFDGTISLSNNGLIGNGSQKHYTSTMLSDSILFFPWVTDFLAKKVEMKRQSTQGTPYPNIYSDSALVSWKPYSDTMKWISHKRHPFLMYDSFTRMNGELTLEAKALSGNGFLDFDEAKISSNFMKFNASKMHADTASMEIVSLGESVTFKTPNVRADMDFDPKIGYFKSNDSAISTDFANNRYKADINEFKWDIPNKILTFKAKEGSRGSRFISTDAATEGLFMYCKVAEYDLVKSIISMDSVDEILIADSRVLPGDGKVKIFPEGKIEPLKNAAIQGDTLNEYHRISEADIQVFGKNDIKGKGNYTLLVNNTEFPIKINTIQVAKRNIGTEKKPNLIHTIEGIGSVKQAENLKIYRNTDFFGNVHIYFNQKYPHFEGLQRIRFENPSYATPWFQVNNEINVSQLQMYKDSIFDQEGNSLYTGILLDKEKFQGPYTNLLAPKKFVGDKIIFDARGMILHQPDSNLYFFGDSNCILHDESKGNMMTYNESAGKIKSRGKFNPQLGLNGIPLFLGGNMDINLNENYYKFMGCLALNLAIDPRIMEMIKNFLKMEFDVEKSIDFNKKETYRALQEFFSPKDLKVIDKDLAENGTLMRDLKNSDFNMFLTNILMEYSNTEVTFRSVPQFGIGVIQDIPIGKACRGYIELGYGEVFDFFNIYIVSRSREWLYISYSDGFLGILSSNDEINRAINVIEPKKRIVKTKDQAYRYGTAEEHEVTTFVNRMKKGGKFKDDGSGDGQSMEIVDSTYKSKAIDSAANSEKPESTEGEKPKKKKKKEQVEEPTPAPDSEAAPTTEPTEEKPAKSRRKKKEAVEEPTPESEVAPTPEPTEEKPAKSRRKKKEAVEEPSPESEVAPTPEPTEEKPVKSRRKKKEEEVTPPEPENVEPVEEVKPKRAKREKKKEEVPPPVETESPEPSTSPAEVEPTPPSTEDKTPTKESTTPPKDEDEDRPKGAFDSFSN